MTKRCNTRVVIDIETNTVEQREWFWHEGEWESLKGSGAADTQRQEQLDMQKQAYNLQKQQFAQISGAFGKYLNNDIGYSPEAMSAMRSQFLNNNSQQFQQAGQGVRQALLARGSGGGDAPVGGDYTRGIASLMGAAANSQASGLLGLDVANQQQALTNRFNTGSLLSGNAAVLNGSISSYGSGAASALDSYVKASNSGPLNSLLSGFGSGLGQGLGSFATGGFGSLGSKAGASGGGGGGGGNNEGA